MYSCDFPMYFPQQKVAQNGTILVGGHRICPQLTKQSNKTEYLQVDALLFDCYVLFLLACYGFSTICPGSRDGRSGSFPPQSIDAQMPVMSRLSEPPGWTNHQNGEPLFSTVAEVPTPQLTNPKQQFFSSQQVALTYFCFLFKYLLRSCFFLANNYRYIIFYNTCFFKGNFFKRITQHIGMIKTNIGNNT